MLRSWRAVLLLTVFLKLLGFGIVLPLLPHYGRSLGADGFAIGALFAVYSLTQFLLAPLWGALADRIGRRPVLLASIGWGVVAYLLFALADSYETLLLSRFLAGLSAAVIGVSQAYLVDRTPAHERARGMGMLGAAFGMGFVVGPALGAVLSRWGFAAPGYFAACLSALNFFLALRWLPESLPEPGFRAARPSPWKLRGWAPGVVGVLVVLFLSTAAFSVLYPVFPLFLDERFGYGPMQAGILLSLVGLVAAAVQGGALGRLSGWVGERPLLVMGAATMAIGLALLPLCRGLDALIPVLIPLAFGFSVVAPIGQTLLSRYGSAADQAVHLGLGHSVASLARACGPLLGGFLLERFPMSYPFWAGALLLFVACCVAQALPQAVTASADATSPEQALGQGMS